MYFPGINNIRQAKNSKFDDVENEKRFHSSKTAIPRDIVNIYEVSNI